MGYYIRVLGSQDPDVHVDELIQALAAEGLQARFELDKQETAARWTMLLILNAAGVPLAQVERNPVVAGELGQEELDEFREIIEDYKPASAVAWLQEYFDHVKVIYAFQVLNAAFDDSNFDIISNIKQKLWNSTSGILQADGEGFSNEHGYHILWQFDDDVTGDWSCAVINPEGQWTYFIMDLGNLAQRQDFMAGKVPYLARLL